MLPTQVTLIKLTLDPIITLVQSEKKNKCFLMSSAAFLSLPSVIPHPVSPLSLPSSLYIQAHREEVEGGQEREEGRERG